MSQEFSDPEIFTDFIIEAKEHLETIEPNLLLLEKQPRDIGLLDAIFRPMHSLKGASGFLGLPQINDLAHKAENILDELRKGKLLVNPDIMDIILATTDALRTMIDNLETTGLEGSLNTQSIKDRINEVMDGGSPSPAAVQIPSTPQEPKAPVVSTPPPAPSDSDQYALNAVSAEHLADFLEEAHEIVANLNGSLLELERSPDGKDELINDIFRYMHNLKGNSGLLGFTELNALAHEAESLLGMVRKGEMSLERDLIDLLLTATDQVDSLVARVDDQTMTVSRMDVQPMIARLRQVRLGEAAANQDQPETTAPASDTAMSGNPVQPEPRVPDPTPQCEVMENLDGIDSEDLEIFTSTARQQVDNMRLALSMLAKDSTQRDTIDGLYRSLLTLQNSSNYMGFDELHVYAERTAKLVDQARNTDMGFDMFLDLLNQEQEIIADMVEAVLRRNACSLPEPEREPATADSTPVIPQKSAQLEATQNISPAPDGPSMAEVPQEPLAPASPAGQPGSDPGPPAASAGTEASSGPPDTSSSQPAAAAKTKTSTTIRVDHERLDHLMNLIGELIINRNRFSMLSKSLEENPDQVEQVAQQLTESTYAMARISDDLQDTIMQVRMVAVSAVFSRFPRLVRDLSRKSGKDVELITEGEETELDKSIVEVIGDPLVHLIRNSMDHGLEGREERLAAEKPPTGRVWLRAYHKGNSVAIEVEDDGRGIDPAKMRKVAVKKGLMSEEEAARLDDREAVELIFAPGFSSAEQITDISGRGVGMDVVRTNIKNLKGTVNVTSELGKGSKMTLVLPLTLAIIDALMVTVAGAIYAIPLDAVSETTKIDTSMLTDVSGRKAITLRDEVLGIVELTDLLGLPKNNNHREILPVVVITDNDRRLGLVVDRLLERQEVVIKPLGTYLGDIDGISGATIMGDGSVVLILDPHEIYAMATSRQGRVSGS
ncbi:two-component system, chemotaxis family, sensor kinase CheA [Desulfonatronum thiosulfatophilum]|uniref:Chemotaxis protein CheA n=1 Tax=Desulfonatronum thiosulfatophilum TaxID=617002 RepID=A0A1G6DEH8_9BACT|nr:chemotaxis protein CheA [Desulfonatronum thiosulfatophilum]SDB43546.1 two-component system, chemotaxis family, sensor kinase CheA [Desulfonatronum thiosulfatophilum]